jgi:thiamine biosynthesis lipoprotein
MGMPVTVKICDPDASPAAIDAVFLDFGLLDQTFSTFIPTSDVNRINSGEISIDGSDQLVRQAIDLSRMYVGATKGYFSAWRKGKLDPSGLIKGWAIDRGCSILARWGYSDYFIDAGGDVQTRGMNGAGAPWRVGIRHPVERDKLARVVFASDLAVATSGTYEKGDHIVDPHTGQPVSDWLSLTVVGPDILQADVFATAAFAMGGQALAFIAEIDGYEAFAIDPKLVASWTPGFDAYCQPQDHLGGPG